MAIAVELLLQTVFIPEARSKSRFFKDNQPLFRILLSDSTENAAFRQQIALEILGASLLVRLQAVFGGDGTIRTIGGADIDPAGLVERSIQEHRHHLAGVLEGLKSAQTQLEDSKAELERWSHDETTSFSEHSARVANLREENA